MGTTPHRTLGGFLMIPCISCCLWDQTTLNFLALALENEWKTSQAQQQLFHHIPLIQPPATPLEMSQIFYAHLKVSVWEERAGPQLHCLATDFLPKNPTPNPSVIYNSVGRPADNALRMLLGQPEL